MLTLKPFDYNAYSLGRDKYLDNSFSSVKHLYPSVVFEIVRKCLNFDQTKRPSAAELIAVLQPHESEFMDNTTSKTVLSPGNEVKGAIVKKQQPKLQPITPHTESEGVRSYDSVSSSDVHQKQKQTFDSLKRRKISWLDVKKYTNSHGIQKNSDNLVTKNTYTSSQVIQWTVDDVCNWLQEMGYAEYKKAFIENEINGEALLELETYEDFKHLQVKKLGHIKLLQKYIRIMNHN